ncbi:nucleolar protein 12-domain-containing protein [Poronia punctata]|nr:nucleolar protein 12-domain-containing protein [Poronia punctata]
MFARPRPKKLLAPPSKKRKRHHNIEEIKFDETARVEYLTGFHKRKLQRVKFAQEQAAKQAREDKIIARKQIREERKKEVENHVQSVHDALKKASQAGYIDSDEDDSSAEDAAEEWGGFQDVPAEPDLVDHEEEYVDEDRYTTVTVESVNVSKDGLTSSRPEDESENEETLREQVTQAQPEKKSSKDQHVKKKKKQKFRYETKLERQITNIKQKAKNRRKPKE